MEWRDAYYTLSLCTLRSWIPVVVVELSYLFIYREIKRSQNSIKYARSKTSPSYSTGLARSFFIMYTVSTVCWAPYTFVAILDRDYTFSHEDHLYITVWAHVHPSFNWIIYYFTNTKIEAAFNQIVHTDSFFGNA